MPEINLISVKLTVCKVSRLISPPFSKFQFSQVERADKRNVLS